MKEQMIEKTSLSRYFELKRRFKMSVNENGERRRVSDDLQYKRDFEEMIKMIPNGKAGLVVIAFFAGDSKIVEVVKSQSSLRSVFKSGIKVKDGESFNRYHYYKAMLWEGRCSYLKVQMIS